ncbi:MAG: hypothetical protein CMP91_03815 [Gammaproteobacteria bacterium]|nr:hypothetical protein [Gammaproteobacteria bacterium]MAY01806.1 hypothetical protein [Gammaproteobacteria bacterium]|tara:strand:+ start:1368 stop:1622 length:255 start_codon:yes stop_codon:yes gene_type:complete
MKLNASALALSFAIVTAILWLVCSLIVVLLPQMAMNMSGNMMHADFSGMQWTMNFIGFLFGLIVWVVIAGVTGWLIATVYNRLV